MVHHSHSPVLTLLSILIAIFASYSALDISNSITSARGRARVAWLFGGSLAMGVGIWSMHFVGMLAFSLPNVQIAYDVPLLILSILVAIVASALALAMIARPHLSGMGYVASSLAMGVAIAGMHYIGIASMRMSATYTWDMTLVVLSILIAITASFVALYVAIRFRNDLSARGFRNRAAGGVILGIAIAGMHYTGMAAMHFHPDGDFVALPHAYLIATDGLAVAVIGMTLIILGVAISGSIVDRALTRRNAYNEQITGILESIADGFFSVDHAWRFTYLNRVAQALVAKLSEIDGRAFLGRELWEVLPSIRGTAFARNFRRATEVRTPVTFTEELPLAGSWFEVRVYPSDEGLSIYFRDVTEHRQAISDRERLQENVRESQTLLETVIMQLPVGVTVAEAPSGRVVLQNLEAERLLEHEISALNALADDPSLGGRHANGRSYTAEEYPTARAIRDGVAIRDEELRYYRRSAGPAILSVNASPIRNRRGEMQVVVTTFYDLTERRKVEERLSLAEKRATFLSEATKALISDLDYSARLKKIAQLLVVNFADACLIELREEKGDPEVIASHRLNSPWADIVLAGQLTREFSEAKETQFLPELPEDHPLRNHGIHSFIAVPLRAHERIVGTLTLIREGDRRFNADDHAFALLLADRAALAVDNAILYRNSQDAIRARDEFLSICSHELKTPITSLKLQFQMAERQAKKGDAEYLTAEATQRRIRNTNRQLTRLNRLIEDMLDVSRIATGKMSFTMESVDLVEIVREVLERFTGQFEVDETECQLVTEQDSIVLPGDRLRIEQVISNLLTNAQKYGDGKPIRVTVRKSGDSGWIEFRDRGVGIGPEHLERIFARFERAISATNISGLGLGLFISRQIIEAHRGDIYVESVIGEGSTFTVRLPLT